MVKENEGDTAHKRDMADKDGDKHSFLKNIIYEIMCKHGLIYLSSDLII